MLIEINWHPSRRELMWFGGIMAGVAGVIGGVIWWRFEAPAAAWWLWGVVAVLVAVYYAAPAVRRPMYVGWLVLTYPIGWALGHVVLGLVYYGVATPIGLIMKAVGRDPMRRRFEPEAESYWEPHRPTEERSRYFRQF